jgi:hypothetical protein
LTQSFSYLSKIFLQDKDLGATTMNEAPVNPAFPSVQKASTGAPPGVFTPSLLSAYWLRARDHRRLGRMTRAFRRQRLPTRVRSYDAIVARSAKEF